MPTRKNVRKPRSSKTRSNKRHKRHSKSFFSGGSCSACGSCMNSAPNAMPLFKGGKICMGKRRGGHAGNDNPPSFSGLPLRYYYGQNDFMKDPIDPSHQLATRQLPNKFGGKNKTKKMKKGGNGLHFSFLSGQSNTSQAFNPTNTIGEIGTSNIPANILSGNVSQTILPNPSVFYQPVNDKYNIYNRPLA